MEDPDLRRLSLISKQRNHIETYTYFSSSVKTKCKHPNQSFTKNEMIPTIYCVGTLDDVIDWPPHPSPRGVLMTRVLAQRRHQTSHFYVDTCDDVIKSHSHGVAHLIQWPLLLPTAIDLLCAERRFMATFLSPITSRRCVFCGSQGIAKGNYCGSQWVKCRVSKFGQSYFH